MTKILIVEDNEADRFLGKVIIENANLGMEIHFANDGIEALESLEVINGIELILLDINMPKMNGHEFLEKHAAKHDDEIPVVVMLTSSDQNQDKEKAFSYSCVKDYLLKPIAEDKLKKLVTLVEEMKSKKNNT